MTTRQQKRLELAEAVCRLAMRHRSCGLVEKEGYRPDVTVALHVMQRAAEREGNLKPGALHWLGDAAVELGKAIFEWMEAVGIDPKSHDKAEAKLMAMEIAREVGGEGFEGDITQTEDAKRVWVERTADDRAADVVQEISAGKIKGFGEIRMAIAAEILEAEHVAREPFVRASNAMYEATKHPVDDVGEPLRTAFCEMMKAAWRWLDLEPKETDAPEPEGAD